MNSTILPPVWKLLVVVLAFVPVVWGDIAKCRSGWGWSNNSKKQNPCEVTGYLQGACLGYAFELGPLDPDYWYTNPQEGDAKDLECSCNTVIYNLYSACTACQNVSTEVWSQWSQNCEGVYVSQYPFEIPGGTAIPRWAFMDITKADDFNATAARRIGRNPEVLGKVPVTLSMTSSRSSMPSSDPSTSSSTSDPSNPLPTDEHGDLGGNTSNNESRFPIVGAAIGGVAGFLILSLLIWFALRYHSRKSNFPAARSITRRPFSQHTFSTRSFYLSTPSVYSPEPGMGEDDRKTPGVYSPFDVTPSGPAYGRRGDPRSMVSDEFDVHTTDLTPLWSGKDDDEPTAF